MSLCRAFGWMVAGGVGLAATEVAATPIGDSLLRDRLVGAWADGGDCSRGGLLFKADGTFAVTGVYADTDFSGTFDVVDGKLIGTTPAMDMPVLTVEFDSDGALLLGLDVMERCPTPPPPPNPGRP